MALRPDKSGFRTGAQELDALAYYRHIAPLERKDIYLLHRGEHRLVFPTTRIPATSNLHYYSPNRDSEIAPTA